MMRVGILGAGQLGRMLALAGLPLGLDFSFLDPAEAPCAAVLGRHLRADYTDEKALDALCAQSDVVSLEFENVPVAAAQYIAQFRGMHPGAGALAVAQDRIVEKQFLNSIGVPTAPFRAVDSRADLDAAVAELGLPAVLKTRRMGYDGKGQALLRSAEDVNTAWAALGNSGNDAGSGLILEGFVPFIGELSCIAARAQDGQMAFYPLSRNVHRGGILRRSTPLAQHPLNTLARDYTRRLLEALDYVGVLALELFELDGALLANEFAPRVHNSGHWSIEGAECSQFENHLRAVCGLPLGSTALRGACTMYNIIGEEPDYRPALALPGVHVHRYAKSAKAGRKLAHVTVTAADDAALAALTRQTDAIFGAS